MALRNHMIHVDQLLMLQDSRLKGLSEEFEKDVNILQEEFDMVNKNNPRNANTCYKATNRRRKNSRT